ncbi:MAG: pantetheine-phosphate adenylyltransferase [Bacteroidales bacterium]|nr:pantetheine-phosphate adenylyltransferase [Bacteroidales bacterium]
MKRIAVFPGSFDPVTLGHLQTVLSAMPLFDRIIVALGENTSKRHMFSLQQRLQWLHTIFDKYDSVSVDSYTGLTVDYCKHKDAGFIIRGVRNTTDFQYETEAARINKQLNGGITTVFLPSDSEMSTISSSVVRELLVFGKDVSFLLPPEIVITPQDIIK